MGITFFDDVKKILEKRSKTLAISLALFFLFSFAFGQISARTYQSFSDEEKSEIMAGLEPVFDRLRFFKSYTESGEYLRFAFLIFLNNFRAAVFHMAGGMILLPALLTLFGNGFLIGFLFSITGFPSFSILEAMGFVVVLMLEASSFILASAEGVHLGASLLFPRMLFKRRISRKKAFIATGKESLKILAFIAILLLVASATETLVIYSYMGRA